MSNETALVVRGQAMPIANMQELKEIGEIFARSGMFGCKTVEQGCVLALTCHMTGKHPVRLKEEYHLIDGNLSKRADAMLASLREHGGEYEIVSRTPDKAEIKIACGKAKGSFSLEWTQARQEPFPWSNQKDKDGNPALKKNWRTPRARMQMLWARVVSDGVRACCPQAVQGSYVPEELQDLNNSGEPPQGAIELPPDEVEVIKPDGKKVTPPPAAPKTEPAPAQKPAESAPAQPAVDYTCLPIGAKKGTHFKELTVDELRQVVNADPVKHAQVTDKHKRNAANWLKKKEAAEAKEGGSKK